MATCSSCSIAIPEGNEVVFQGKDKKSPNLTVCSNCAATIEAAHRAETEGINLPRALLLGLGAAVVASLVWYAVVILTKYQTGLVAIGVGWLVAQAVMFGAGRKRGLTLQGISIALTLLAMASSEYLVMRYFAVQALAEEGITGIPLFLSLDVMIELIVDSLSNDPLTLLFWLLAAYMAFTLPAARKLKRVDPWETKAEVPIKVT